MSQVLLSFTEHRRIVAPPARTPRVAVSPEYRQLLDQVTYLDARNPCLLSVVARLVNDMAVEVGWTAPRGRAR